MKKIFVLLILIILAAAGWYFGSPLFIDQVVDEELPENFVLPTQEEFENMTPEEREQAERDMIEMFADQNTIVEEEMPQTATVVSQGVFVDADSFHRGSGVAKIITQDGNSILRFEDFDVTNGPDLHVLLVQNPIPTDQDNLGEYIDLGQLKGNKGNQNYVIPEDVDLSRYGSIVIYCEPFHVIFSTATLE